MIIGICGFGYTGSGAVLDFLKEFEENSVLDGVEFSISYFPDCLEDLEYHLMWNSSRFMSSDVAIKRFIRYINGVNTPNSAYMRATSGKFVDISYDFINSLIQVKWKGFWFHDFIEAGFIKRNFDFRLMVRVLKFLDKVKRKNTNIRPNKDMYLSIKPESFYTLAREYVKNIIKAMGGDLNKNIVLDQPFSADNPEKSFKFFDDPKAIIVDKDPRDLYLLAKTVILSKGRFIPSDNVEDFVKYYKLMRVHQSKDMNDSRILKINFEDLIYEYERTSKVIAEFVGVKKHRFQKKYFDPEISKYNTQLFNKYTDCKDEIGYIEKELKDMLYPFEKYEKITHYGKSF